MMFTGEVLHRSPIQLLRFEMRLILPRRRATRLRRRRLLLALLAVVCHVEGRQRHTRTYVNPCHVDFLMSRFRSFEAYLSSVNPASFHKYTRMYPAEFEDVYQRIAQRLEHGRTHVSPISGRQRLAMLCRFLGHGSSYCYMAQEFSIGTSTVMQCVYEVCKIIIDEYFREMFPLPTRSTWAESAREFKTLWRYPRAVAALDGKHFECFRPRKSGSSFYNFKGYYSIVLLALCDAQYRILMFDLGAKGKSSDAGIYQESPMRTFIENHLTDFPSPASLEGFGVVSYHILADQGFAQAVHMQRPFNRLQAESDSGIAHFNKCFSSARRVVESLFGILASRFRLFLRPIHATQEHAKMLILTAMILHNMLAKSVPARAMRCRYLQSHDEGEEEREPPQQQEDVQNLRAKRERELLVQYFCWRDNVIRREFQ